MKFIFLILLIGSVSAQTLTPLQKHHAYAVLMQAKQNRIIETEVSDVNDTTGKFYPILRHLWFKGRCGFSLRLKEVSPGSGKDSVLANGIIAYAATANHTVLFYPLPSGRLREEGGFEMLSKFKAEPPSNVIRYALWSQNVTFALNDTSLIPANIKTHSHFADSLIGSYAVYADRSGNFLGGNNYMTGKLCQIPLPYIISATGAKAFCQIFIDTVGDSATVTMPQSFIDTCSYPIIVDPTFGYTSGGAFAYTNNAGVQTGSTSSTHTAGAAEKITGFSIYADDAFGNTIDMAAYTIVSAAPVTRLAAAVTATISSSTAWYSVSSLNQSMTNGTTYGVAFGNMANATNIYYDSPGGTARYDNTDVNLPATWTNNGVFNENWSVYATYSSGTTTAYQGQQGVIYHE